MRDFINKQFDKLLMLSLTLTFLLALIYDKDPNHLETLKLLTTGAFSSFATLLTKSLANAPIIVEPSNEKDSTETKMEIK